VIEIPRRGSPVAHPIATVNWPDFPACCSASFRISWDGERIVLLFEVRDLAVRAVETADNGPVWHDRCVEWFLSPCGESYYNMEWNAAGTMLCQHGPSRRDRVFLPPERLALVERRSSLGPGPIPLTTGPLDWSLEVKIPLSFFGDDARRISPGATVRGNFYLCGDDLPDKQYLSCFPIRSERPDFHRPECFGPLRFL